MVDFLLQDHALDLDLAGRMCCGQKTGVAEAGTAAFDQ